MLRVIAYLGYIPNVLVLIGGLVAALVFWRKVGASAVWAVVGFGILLLVQLFGLVQGPLIEQFSRAMGMNISVMVAVLSMILGLIRTAGIGCILVALVAAWRSRS